MTSWRDFILFIYLFRNSQLSTKYNAVKSRTEMTIVTTVRYQVNALTDTFNANRVQCLTLLVHTGMTFFNGALTEKHTMDPTGKARVEGQC